MIYHDRSLTILYQYHEEEWYVYHSDLSRYVSDYCISITKKSDTSITVIYLAMPLTTVSVSLRRVICLSQSFITICLWLLYQYHEEEWYVYHSDLSRYVSDYCISITKKSDNFIGLSQWFITPCLWLYCISITKKSDVYHIGLSRYVSEYCISITKKSDRSITVIYHAMSLTTVSVSLRRVICLSQWFIMPCLWLYCISITKKSDTSITVIYHAMSDYCISITKKSDSLIGLSQWFITPCLWLLYQYH